VCVAATCTVSCRQFMAGKPLRMQSISAANLIAWNVGAFISAIFAFWGLFGSYKGLYCMVSRPTPCPIHYITYRYTVAWRWS
jgi:hypothetical protein